MMTLVENFSWVAASLGLIVERRGGKRNLANRGDAVGTARECRGPRIRQLAIFSFFLTTFSSVDAAGPGPVPVPDGARSVALAYRSQWIEAAKRNPVFYNVDGEMQIDKVVVLDGFASVMLIGPDVVRFAKSGESDPVQFATRTLFEFPMMVEGIYVGNIVVRPRISTDPGTADYVFSGGTDPGGSLDKVVDRFGGYSQAPTFSVVSFVSDSFAGVFLRVPGDDRVQFVPVNPEAEALFLTDGDADALPVERAVPLIRTRILDHVRE